MKTLRTFGFNAVAFLSFAVALYAIGIYALTPIGAFVHPDMRTSFAAHATAVYLHVFGAAFALALGPLQFYTRLRRERPTLHRWLGRLYLGIGVAIGGSAGFYLAFHAAGGLIAQTGFGTLSALWLYTGLRAFLAIRRREVKAHRRWMLRNFALALAAVTLRLYLPAAMAAGIDFAIAYPLIAWLCWLPNVIVADRLLHTPAR